MPNDKDRQIEKLKKQVKRFEEKGYTDTAAHKMLANLLKDSAEGVSLRSTKKVKQETTENGEQNL